MDRRVINAGSRTEPDIVTRGVLHFCSMRSYFIAPNARLGSGSLFQFIIAHTGVDDEIE